MVNYYPASAEKTTQYRSFRIGIQDYKKARALCDQLQAADISAGTENGTVRFDLDLNQMTTQKPRILAILTENAIPLHTVAPVGEYTLDSVLNPPDPLAEKGGKYKNLPSALKVIANAAKAAYRGIGALKIIHDKWVELGRPEQLTEDHLTRVRHEIDAIVSRKIRPHAERNEPNRSRDTTEDE